MSLLNWNLADFAKRHASLPNNRENRPLYNIFGNCQCNEILLPILTRFSEPHYQFTIAFVLDTGDDILGIGLNCVLGVVDGGRPGRM